MIKMNTSLLTFDNFISFSKYYLPEKICDTELLSYLLKLYEIIEYNKLVGIQQISRLKELANEMTRNRRNQLEYVITRLSSIEWSCCSFEQNKISLHELVNRYTSKIYILKNLIDELAQLISDLEHLFVLADRRKAKTRRIDKTIRTLKIVCNRIEDVKY